MSEDTAFDPLYPSHERESEVDEKGQAARAAHAAARIAREHVEDLLDDVAIESTRAARSLEDLTCGGLDGDTTSTAPARALPTPQLTQHLSLLSVTGTAPLSGEAAGISVVDTFALPRSTAAPRRAHSAALTTALLILQRRDADAAAAAARKDAAAARAAARAAEVLAEEAAARAAAAEAAYTAIRQSCDKGVAAAWDAHRATLAQLAISENAFASSARAATSARDRERAVLAENETLRMRLAEARDVIRVLSTKPAGGVVPAALAGALARIALADASGGVGPDSEMSNSFPHRTVKAASKRDATASPLLDASAPPSAARSRRFANAVRSVITTQAAVETWPVAAAAQVGGSGDDEDVLIPSLPVAADEVPPISLAPLASAAPTPLLSSAVLPAVSLTGVALVLAGLPAPVSRGGEFGSNAGGATGFSEADVGAARAALLPSAPAAAFGRNETVGLHGAGATWGGGHVLSGFLFKKSAQGPTGAAAAALNGLSWSAWTWRFATISRGRCDWFASEFDSDTTNAKNGFNLADVVAVRPVALKLAGKAHAFEVWLASGKVYIFAPQTSAERNAWGGLLSAIAAWRCAAEAEGVSLKDDAGDSGAAQRQSRRWLL